jgi:hypothetical protein
LGREATSEPLSFRHRPESFDNEQTVSRVNFVARLLSESLSALGHITVETVTMQVVEILEENKSDSPMYDLNDTLKQQMMLPLDVTFEGLEGYVQQVGEGEWQVFHAPHLVGLSRFFGATISVRYRLEGNAIYSNVLYRHPIFGSGWLSASGALQITPCRSTCNVYGQFY